MKKKAFNIWTVVFACALLTGIICNGFFPFIYLAMGTVIAMGLIVVGFVIDLLAKSSKGIRFTGFIFIFFVAATLTSFASIELSRNRAEKQGNKIVEAAYQYRAQYGHFPKDIGSLYIDNRLKKKFAKRNGYSTDSTMNHFELEVHSDGWHWTVFRSKDSLWVTED